MVYTVCTYAGRDSTNSLCVTNTLQDLLFELKVQYRNVELCHKFAKA